MNTNDGTLQGVTVRSIRALRGPNIYAYMPVLHTTLDIGPYEEQPSNQFAGFAERLGTWLPGLHSHECSLGRPGGFMERLRRGTHLAHICEHVALELQKRIGFDVSFARVCGTGEHGVYDLVIAYKEEQPARMALDTALRLTLAAMHDEPFDLEAEIDALMVCADEYRLGPSTSAIVEAARGRSIPVLRITPQESLVQLGYGVHQKRIQASETSNTSAIAVSMCQEKALTNRMLRTVGVPVPEGRVVKSADDAWAAAQEIGEPVVVKPEDGNQGKGVSVHLTAETEVRAAYALAREFRDNVLVERAITGDDYRLLVVNGTFVAAARRDPAHVVGDGEHTVAELVEIVNRDPRRRAGHVSILTRIRLDIAAELVLHGQGMTVDTVPAMGQTVKLRTNANLSTGGTATDVTDEVHPDNARLAELAAQILALDVAGIDMICADIRRPLRKQAGAIVEVNAAPGLRMHLHPATGRGRDVGKPIIDMLYPDNAPSRIPIIAVTGTNGKTTVTRLIGHMYMTARYTVGLTSTEGIYIDDERIMEGDCSGPQSARAVLLHPRVEVAVLETARGGILREGLAFDRCTIGVVTNISADHLGLRGINTLEDLVKVKQVVVEAVASNGAAVLNADDPRVAEMAAVTDAEVVYFGTSIQQHVIAAHLAEGGRCVIVDNGQIVLAEADERVDLIELSRLGFTAGGAIGFQVQNALAATAAAWAAGLNPALIARALATFATNISAVPGRFNVTEIGGVQLVMDYGHNQAAMSALGQAVQTLGSRKTVLVFALPGDRRDADIAATTVATHSFADEYVLYDPHERRGRAEGEIPQLIQASLPAGAPWTLAASHAEACRAGWQRVKPGDRLVVMVESGDDVHSVLQILAESDADYACATPRPLAREVAA